MAIMKNKAVVKLQLPDAKSKKAARRALVDIDGFSSYTVDFEKSTLVVLGVKDPIALVKKLRKFVTADLERFEPGKDGGGNVDQQQQNVYPPYDGYGYNHLYYH